jgi:hypothetical protein
MSDHEFSPSLTAYSNIAIWKLGRTVCVYSMVRYLCVGLMVQDNRKEKSRVQSLKEQSQTLGLRLMYICNIKCCLFAEVSLLE